MKISSPYSVEINAALKENNPALEFAQNTSDAEIALPKLPMPVRIGEILDYLEFALGKNINIGNFKLDIAKNTISLGATRLDLTEKETALLKYLAENNAAASRDEMLKTIWGYSDNADSKTVENHIYRLRKKISATFGVEIIKTESGGYKLIEK